MKPVLLALVFSSFAAAAEFPELYNSDPGNPQPTPAKGALKMLKLPKGFKATLFAAEPDVQNPIGLSWDARGRMWVAENYTYAERAKRFDLGLKDRVIILEDKDWDGVAETRKVFTEDVQMLTSVEVGRDGVWLMCPPQVLFIPDRNHDDIPDGEPEVVIDGFTVAKDNYHNFANGLRFGPDGWLYGRCGHSCPGRLGIPGTPDDQRVPMKGGIWRYHPEKKIVEVLTHGTTNPWGHDWDANGEMFFINTVTGHLWHLMHGAHLVDSSKENPFVYEKLDTIADHYHYDRSGSWTASRDGKANSLGGGHAHIGMMIYQAEQWPKEYRNKLFTLNMHGRRANVERLERNGSGYVGKHEPDVFLSDDPWFRGIEISTGPDGSGFILDWSDTGECHDSTGVHRTSGRIFRVSYGEAKKPEVPFAWRKAWPKADLNSADEHARALAIRELTQFSPIDAISGPMPHAVYPELGFDAVKLAKEDTSSFVRLTLASTLQRMPVAKREELGAALLAHAEDANDPFLPYLVWYGISPLAAQDPQALVALAKDCTWPKTLRWMARSLATQPGALNALLAQAKAGQVEDILGGMADAFKGIRKAAKPEAWDGFVKLAAGAPEPAKAGTTIHTADPERAKARTTYIQELSILFGDGRALDDVKKMALDEKADLSARESALKTLIENKPDDLRAICTQLLEVRGLNITAVRGLALFDDPEIGQKLAGSYRKFGPAERPTVIDTLVSRPSFAKALLKDMAVGKIPRADLTAFHARQINAFKDEALSKQLVEVWGELRESAADKKELIEKVKKQLTPATLAKANLSQGRMLFTAICGACHAMYGQGGKIGPDLTGSGRANLDYLLENIADPSGVVSADFRMSLLTHKDGRVLSGVVTESNARTLTLRTMTETLTLDRADIVKQETSPLSMMPEGLLLAFQPEQVRDLIAYLMHPVQVPLPKAP
ncbi:MAG: PVC-type heme-binding CxxCH protein [Prosthecobacter sp.]|uniref:PVC-type heme-binding CxxCH protein n=1 Tax=Prosthecobacter sp. TaxID=1965333 RepID=UPI003BB01DA2